MTAENKVFSIHFKDGGISSFKYHKWVKAPDDRFISLENRNTGDVLLFSLNEISMIIIGEE